MSTNVSKQKRKDLTDKIKAIHKYIASAKPDENIHNFLVWLSEIEKELNTKKFGLVFEEHREAIDDTLETHTPVLTENKKLFIDNGGQVNFLIEGDNLAALKLLLKTHKGKIDVIYIDPPYNTGAKDWKYDNDYVDKNDTFRHSKWLSFLNKRLIIAKKLLSESGIICVTIDDYECPNLWLLMSNIFDYENHLGTVVIRNNPKGRMTERKFSLIHEYAIFFGKSQYSEIKKLQVAPSEKTHNYKQDNEGNWYLPVNLRKQGIDSNAINRKGEISHRYYPIYYNPKTGAVSTEQKYSITIEPIDSNGEKRIWRRAKEVIDEMFKNGDLWVKKIKNNYQVYYKFKGGLDGKRPQTIWTEAHFSASDYGTKILDTILGKRELFQFPKAPEAVKQSILSMSNNKKAIILDFFAGSGTTGQAVLELNKKDDGNRDFILCTNNENSICRDVTYERIKRVIKKESYPASLKYYKIDYIPISDKIYYEYADELLEHIRELVELENALNFTGNDKIAIVLTDEELAEFVSSIKKHKNCRKIYRAHNVLVSGKQREVLKNTKIKIIVIPDYYYGELET
jgi:adenine-specific DNA-methyltransferase